MYLTYRLLTMHGELGMDGWVIHTDSVSEQTARQGNVRACSVNQSINAQVLYTRRTPSPSKLQPTVLILINDFYLINGKLQALIH